MSIRVFIIDDQPTFRAGLRVALDSAENVEVVGEAATSEEAAGVLPGLPGPADVILMDIAPGVDAVRLISGDEAAPRVLAMSAAEDDEFIIGALRAGARGVIDRSISGEGLLHSIYLVADGGAAFSALMAVRVCGYFSAIHWLPRRLAFPELTERETQILDLLAQGRDNRSIARALSLAEKTVRNNVTSVYAKLGVTDRTTAALRARQAGLGDDRINRERHQELVSK